MNREKTERACRYVTTVLDSVILAANAGDAALFRRRIEDLLLAAADVQTQFTYEMEMESSTATRKLTPLQAESVTRTVHSSLSVEDKKRLRRMGLSERYQGIGNAADLLDMKMAEKAKARS